MRTTITAPRRRYNREIALDVRLPNDVAIRRRMGSAYARISASGERIRRALDVHHSAVSHRKNGTGPLATGALEIDALERDRINTDPLTDAIELVKLAARGPVCMTTAIRSEAEADTAEDLAAAEFHIDPQGARQRWAEALLAQARESKRLAQALLNAEGSR